MALESLDGFDESLERRRFLASLYRGYLDDVPGIEFQTFSARETSTFKDLTIRVDAAEFGLSRDGLALALLAEGIDTRKYFDPPVHRQRAYGHLESRDLPVTDAVAVERAVAAGVPRPVRRAGRAGLRRHPLGARRTRSSSTRTCRRWPRSTPASSSSTDLDPSRRARRTRARRGSRSARGRRASARPARAGAAPGRSTHSTRSDSPASDGVADVRRAVGDEDVEHLVRDPVRRLEPHERPQRTRLPTGLLERLARRRLDRASRRPRCGRPGSPSPTCR